MGSAPDEAAIIDEAYAELEKDLTRRIAGLEQQIDVNIDSRNHLLQANRAAKTVIEVFNDILAKPKLDKRDISLIVDRITVYEDHIDIQLKPDVDGLLATGVWEESENFPQDSKDISNLPTEIVQSATRRPSKVFTVTVVNSGDPLEIYTSRDGEVIFKKYSLLGGVEDFASDLCETMSRSTGSICAVTDRDTVIAVAGGGRRELMGKRISPELERIMESRKIYQSAGDGSTVPVAEDSDKLHASVAAPILAEGDLLGLVLFVGAEDTPAGETEFKLAQTIAAFLGRHMEG